MRLSRSVTAAAAGSLILAGALTGEAAVALPGYDLASGGGP